MTKDPEVIGREDEVVGLLYDTVVPYLTPESRSHGPLGSRSFRRSVNHVDVLVIGNKRIVRIISHVNLAKTKQSPMRTQKMKKGGDLPNQLEKKSVDQPRSKPKAVA